MTKISFLGFLSNLNNSSSDPSEVMRTDKSGSLRVTCVEFFSTCHLKIGSVSDIQTDIGPVFGSPHIYPSTFCVHFF
jgi:hypothetical protein